jgi:hypothetical protein
LLFVQKFYLDNNVYFESPFCVLCQGSQHQWSSSLRSE